MISAMDGKKRTQRPNRLCMVLMVAILLSPSLATAAEPVLPAGPSLDFSSLLSVVTSLALVLALILAAGWVMRRMNRVQRGGTTALEVVDVLPVGPKEKIILVRAGQSHLLVGLTAGRLSPLGEVNAGDTPGDAPKFEIREQAA